MKDKIKEILSNRADYYIDSNGKSHDIIRGHPDDIMDEIVKLFAIPAVISSFVCGHPPKQTYLNDGIWHCEKCGGKWKSIANK